MNLMRRHYRNGVELSLVGFGGMVAVGMTQAEVHRITGESLDRGVNYFDVAPFYGDGEAEQKLGTALESRRDDIFLACKTLQRSAAGARAELERSLRRLRTSHFDLYQFHAVTTLEEVETIFAPGGAAEALSEARREGTIRFIGFSAHSAAAALAMLDRFPFDSVLFPVNFVCYARGNFGPQVLARAKELGVARVGLKALALTSWRKGEARTHPKCWYKPVTDPGLARQALRFALSEDITSVLPPGDAGLYRMALDVAAEFAPLTISERRDLLKGTDQVQPILKA